MLHFIYSLCTTAFAIHGKRKFCESEHMMMTYWVAGPCMTCT